MGEMNDAKHGSERKISSPTNGHPRGAKNTILLFLWIFGYRMLIQIFTVLQWIERTLSTSLKPDGKARLT